MGHDEEGAQRHKVKMNGEGRDLGEKKGRETGGGEARESRIVRVEKSLGSEGRRNGSREKRSGQTVRRHAAMCAGLSWCCHSYRHVRRR